MEGKKKGREEERKEGRAGGKEVRNEGREAEEGR